MNLKEKNDLSTENGLPYNYNYKVYIYMYYIIQTENLLAALQKTITVIEKRQTLPILANVLLICDEDRLKLKATDLEIEIGSEAILLETHETGEITVPARKLFDICRTLPADSQIKFTLKEGRVYIVSNRSRFVLSTLPATEYPVLDALQNPTVFKISQSALKKLLDKTAFAMAQQDVRYYLNGLLLEINSNSIKSVTTDGHRLALSSVEQSLNIDSSQQIILPRKGIIELLRLIDDSDDEVEISLTSNHIQVELKNARFISKLIDGKFPDYSRVLPSDCPNMMLVNREQLRGALIRTAILTNDKYKGVRFQLDNHLLKIKTHNPEKEEAEEELEVNYPGSAVEVGFNINYLMDILNVIDSELVQFNLKDSGSSCLIHNEGDTTSQYVVMPMRL
ncbi:MAG: DNA polymerase III subunit beta [Gammaproteobacteria bacterium]|nr:DNA polymerase III subunit beta [Gammaproteobacteria bacterium]